VAHKTARTLLFGLWSVLAFGLLGGAYLPAPMCSGILGADPAPASAEKVVYVGGKLSPDALLQFTVATAACKDAVVLLESEKTRAANKAFLSAYHPDQLVAVGSFSESVAEMERRLDLKATPLDWSRRPTRDEWHALFARADLVVVCPAEPRAQLLQAACLAGTVHAPLVIWDGKAEEAEELGELLKRWKTRQLYAIGEAAKKCREFTDVDVVSLEDASAVAARQLKELMLSGPVRTLVVANPSDLGDGLCGMSTLAPWIAARKHAALLLTNAAGANAESVIRAAQENKDLQSADVLIFVANLKAIPMIRRPNPIPGDKDQSIEMEPMTPPGLAPYTFATGRLFHEDPAVVMLMLARQCLLAEKRGPLKALLASNPGSSMPLLETFSRNTAKELRNAGCETTAVFGKDINRDDLRRSLTNHDIFIWEGHHNTLINDYAFPDWDDALPPSLVFLQSCLALTEGKTHPLLLHGAIGVVGSSTRVYSASGAACSLAFFDALLYDDESLGGSLRQAKNFLVAYACLKEKRLGDQAKRSGANLRSAWSFTLWGDPTLNLPHSEAPEDALPPVRHEVHGDTIVLALPEKTHEKVNTHLAGIDKKYQVQMPPNGRLAGLVHKDDYEDGQPLVPFVFAEVHLPTAPPGKRPRLHSRIPSSHYVFCWDEHRNTGYLLVEPRPGDQGELRFRIHWDAPAAAPVREAKSGSMTEK
jgi:hypothetical protein